MAAGGAAGVASAPAPRAIEDWFFAPTWTRSEIPRDLAALQGLWLVLGRADRLTDELLAGLRDGGARCVLVEPGAAFERLGAERFAARPGQSDDLRAVLKSLRASGTPNRLEGVVHLPSTSVDVQEHLIAIAAAVASDADEHSVKVLHVAAGLHRVLDEPSGGADPAVSLGPVLVLPSEMPGLRLRLVDLDARDGHPLPAGARVLCQEAACDDGENLVAWRAGRRWVRRLDPLVLARSPADDRLPLRHRGTYLVTGGLGGLGLAFARWLGERFAARLLLTARTPLPDRQQWDDWLARHPASDRHAQAISAIRAIEAAGGEVLVAAADAADEASMSAALAPAIARWGRFNGLIHAAGISGEGHVALARDPADTRSVMAAKVDGLKVLVRLLGVEELDMVALMASVNGVIGSPGTCDYAAANAWLDAFPDSAERPPAWKHVVAFDWSAWREVGMAVNLVVPAARQAQWQAYLATGIGTADGVEAFARGLASGCSRLVVAPYDLVQAMEGLRRRHGDVMGGSLVAADDAAESAEASAQSSAARPALASEFEPPQNDLERRVVAIWTELLGVDPLGVNDDFFELGGHSLLATRVLARIDQTIGARMALRDIFDAPTVRLLAKRISAAVPLQGGSGDAEDDREEIEF